MRVGVIWVDPYRTMNVWLKVVRDVCQKSGDPDDQGFAKGGAHRLKPEASGVFCKERESKLQRLRRVTQFSEPRLERRIFTDCKPQSTIHHVSPSTMWTLPVQERPKLPIHTIACRIGKPTGGGSPLLLRGVEVLDISISILKK